MPGIHDRVYVYPSHGLAEADRLDGRPARILKATPTRVTVLLAGGDPRSPFCRTKDSVLYLNHDEVSPTRRNPIPYHQ